ncbi:MAG: glycoside hydrolase family 97 protein [Marinoscillum sp.]
MRTLLAGIFILIIATACSSDVVVVSPDGNIRVTFRLVDEQPFYEVKKGNNLIVANSELGFEFKNQPPLSGELAIKDITQSLFDETWVQPWGEVKNIRNHYNELTVTLQEKSELERIVKVTFRVYDDGLGFRYEFPEQPNLKDFVITKELTAFNLNYDLDAWWIPAYGDEIDSEFLFSKNRISTIGQKAHTPLTMQSGDSLFLSIHEAALMDYAAMTLDPNGTKLTCDLVPWSNGDKVIASTPLKTPWRTIQIGDSAGDLITSYLILNLNEPNKLADLSYIKPGKYNGIWWGMHLNKYTWSKGPNHGAASPIVKKYIDFAADNNLSGVLVEGWNEGWDFDWSEGKFNFTTPYPDFDIESLSRYARDNEVSLIGHHETGGNIENYERQLPEAFKFYQKYGIHQVKTGYVTRRPNGEYHQGQFMVRHYQRVLEMAAEHQIALDIHEPVKATGLRRTYPNLMTREGARGTEYEAWSEGNPPEHTVILPFTRCLAGPLDYTPGIFDIMISNKPQNRVHTTLAKQLALYVTIYSPLQMAADLPENYENQPAFQFIRDVPTDWEETRVVNAKIGDYLTIARKDRNSDDWYLGSTTDENPREFNIPLDFLIPGKKYLAQVYADSQDTDLEHNPVATEIKINTVTAGQSFDIRLAPGGGQAVRFQLLE